MTDYPLPDLRRPVDEITRNRALMFAGQSGIDPERLSAAESRPDAPLVSFPLRTDWEQARLLERYPDGVPYRYKKGSEEYEEIHAELIDPRAPFPAPRCTSREYAGGMTAPDSVLKLAEFARESSWEVRMQWAQGNVPHGTTGRPGALKDSWALRFGAHPMTDRQAYAVYMRTASGGTWAWDGIMIWGPDLPPYAGCLLAELKIFLEYGPADDTAEMLAWVAEVKRLHAQQEQARKARPKAAPKSRESAG